MGVYVLIYLLCYLNILVRDKLYKCNNSKSHTPTHTYKHIHTYRYIKIYEYQENDNECIPARLVIRKLS